MNVERRTSAFAAAAACIGSAMLGIGEENYTLALIAVVVGVGSVVLCDRLKWLQLGNVSSNIASIAVLAFAFYRSAHVANELRILVMADLMAHLQFILQFKPKTVRNYWLLILVSFLQASVAAALHTGVLFALLLLIYLFCALFFLGYFFLYREQARYAKDAATAEAVYQKRSAGFAGRLSTLPPAEHIAADFTRRMFGIGLGTIALSAFFFVAVPRIGQTGWVPTSIVDSRAVGFTPSIDLTRSGGEILQDPEVVMQVRFFDYKTGLPRHIDGDVYMRGTSVTQYDNGKWRAHYGMLRRSELPALTGLNGLASDEGVLRQRVAIEPLLRDIVFSSAPPYTDQPAESKLPLTYNSLTGQVSRNDALRRRRLEYDIITPGFQRHRQGDLIPDQGRAGKDNRLLDLPAAKDGIDPLAGLRDISQQIVADVPASEPFKRAKKLEAYLRDSGRFLYSLQPPERPQDVDPVEDFVVNRPEGHCEYFAGALALMLRSVGIPSRVVIGFRGGYYNVVGDFYEFQQLHAHSWVEAFLPPGQVPLERLADTPGLIPLAEEYGAWLQLDGTTAASAREDLASSSTWFQVQQTLDYVKFLWNNYVVGMDSVRQQDSIYQPLVSSIAETSAKLTSRETWQELKDKAWSNLPSRESQRGLLIWAGLAGLLLAAGGGLFWLLRAARLRRAAGRKQSLGRGKPTEEFYLQLERILRRLNLQRTDDQTPREFALAAGGELAELAQTRSAAPLPRRIVDYYYRVRFGNRPLADTERHEVEQALTALAAAMPENKTEQRLPPPKQNGGSIV